MALSTTATRKSYAGNASTVAFSFPYVFFAADDLKVSIIEAGVETLQSSGYSVTGGNGSTGTVTFDAAPSGAQTVVIFRDPDLTQEDDFDAEADPLPVITSHADLVETKLQALRGSSLRVSAGVAESFDGEISLLGNSGKVVSVNTNEDGFSLVDVAEASSDVVTNTASDTKSVTQSLAGWLDFDDTSAVLGSAAKFFYPDYYGNAATGRVYRFNRVMVGAAALSSADRINDGTDHPTTNDYLQTATGAAVTSMSQIVGGSAIGGLGVSGFSRTSDYRTWAAAASGGSQGVNGFAINDDTGAGNPIACAVFGEAFHESGITGLTEAAEFTINNHGTVADVRPHAGVIANSTMGVNITVGHENAGGAHTYTANASCAWHVGRSAGGGTAVFRRGMVAAYNAFDTTLGSGGSGIFADLYTGQSIQWVSAADATLVEIWGDATGGFTAQGAQCAGRFVNSTDTAANRALRIESKRATPSTNDSVIASFYLQNSAATAKEFGRLTCQATDVTNASEDALMQWSLMVAGSLTGSMQLQLGSLRPVTNDGIALGSTGGQWSDAFLASGAVINFAAGDVTITHSSHALAFAGGSNGYSFDDFILCATAKGIKVNAVQVVTNRVTGFTTSSGTANKNASGINVDTITASDANIRLLGAWVKAINDAITTHGLIGT